MISISDPRVPVYQNSRLLTIYDAPIRYLLCRLPEPSSKAIATFHLDSFGGNTYGKTE